MPKRSLDFYAAAMLQPKQTRVRPVDQTRMTPNQLVAWNLSQARRLRWWTQEEAARRLEPFLGERWSKAVFSAAERSIMGGRIRNFTADDLYAFARVFELPISFFLAPADWVEEVAPSGTDNEPRAGP